MSPFVSSLFHSWVPFPSFSTFPFLPPLIYPPHFHFSILFSTPPPCPSLLLSLPSPTLPCLAKGQISRGNQQRQTRSSDFIIIINLPLQFLPQGSKPAQLELRTVREAEAAAWLFSSVSPTTPCPHSSLAVFISLWRGQAPCFLAKFFPSLYSLLPSFI